MYDGEPAISARRGGKVWFTQEFLAFEGALGMGAVVLEPGHPEREDIALDAPLDDRGRLVAETNVRLIADHLGLE